MISAVRASGTAPISEKTLSDVEIGRRNFGQDVPLVLQGAAPSLTSYAETANYWGYSYIRLRGIDQSRINLTLDGIPLNDPEDQVLYFADFPDLANSLSSVQVQRGVGTSSNGTAAYAGSINMETIPLAASPRVGEVQLEGGSFGSRARQRRVPERVSCRADSRWYGARIGAAHRRLSLPLGRRRALAVSVAAATSATATSSNSTRDDGHDARHDGVSRRRARPTSTRTGASIRSRRASVTVSASGLPRSRIRGFSARRRRSRRRSYRISASGDYDVLIDSL